MPTRDDVENSAKRMGSGPNDHGESRRGGEGRSSARGRGPRHSCRGSGNENGDGEPLNIGRRRRVHTAAPLCAFHHNAVHHDGFVVKALGGGRFRSFTPEGLPLGREGARMLVEVDNPAVALIRRNHRRGIGRPRWDAAAARYETERQIPDELLFRA